MLSQPYFEAVGTSGQIMTSRFMKATRSIFTHPAVSDAVQGLVDNNTRVLHVRTRGIG